MPRAAKPAPGPLSHAIAEILRAQMGRLGVSRSAIARATNRSSTGIAEIIRGATQADVEQLDDICIALGLNLTKVINEAEEQTSVRLLDSRVQFLGE